jgi:hypothetical protein
LLSEVNPCEIIKKIKTKLFIILPTKPVDDSLSVYAFNEFIKIFVTNWLFIVSEITKFNNDRYKIDDYILSKDCKFLLDEIYTVYSKAIDRYQSLIASLKKRIHLHFLLDENIRFSKKSFHLKDEIERKSYRKSIFI